jgi:sulfate/thiosulfate transport system ATP-binding protein
MSIQVRNITKNFNDFRALDNVNLDIHSGELIALLGPSGSGKTTLLRIIAGLEFADSGSVLFDGENTNEKSLKERNVGFVFQHYALFKHMTVFENVAFGLRVRPRKKRPSNAEITEKVMKLLTLVHLDKLHDRYPSQLSGGQRQRVALARSLAVEPKVLLLDEPFGALDSKVRKELRRWMRRLHDELHVTSIFVTHDQEEAMEVADRVVVMSHGNIEQVGTPAQVYNEPTNAFVYDFLGNFNAFEGWKGEDNIAHITEYEVTSHTVTSDHAKHGGWLAKQPVISTVLHTLIPRYFHEDSPRSVNKKTSREIGVTGKPITIFARPHEMDVTKTLDDGKDYIKTSVLHINPAGALVKLELERENGSIIQAEIPKELFISLDLQKNDVVYTRPRDTRIFE